jgi:IS30 family transposase
MIRQYIPKSTSLETLNYHYIETISACLNNRPGKKLGFETPGEALNKYLWKNNFALII